MPRKITLCIDPGHGLGNRKYNYFDPGAVNSKENQREADIALDLALTIKYIANSKFKDRIEVVLTRPDNKTNCSLAHRTSVCKESGADGFISIHLNSASASAKGTETFFRSKEKDYKLAEAVQNATLDTYKFADRGLKYESKSQHKRIYVLGQSVPACLLEVCFISNSTELKTVLSREKRIEFAMNLLNNVYKALA